ncbi:MAG: PDZ domain-containing protein [Sediminibacterium sp.]|jgi:serine protease Do|nr:PDZ domain-containing protein [Sediminibacterium sp.]
MIKQVSSFLIACVIAQISFAQTSEKQNLKLDLRKPTVVVVKNIPKDTSIAVKGETPLYIVDGKEIKNINEVSPKDIEKIDVLKGASATALYGKKGEKGVVVITTKKKNNASANKDEKELKEVTVKVLTKEGKGLKNNKEDKKENGELTEERVNVLIDGDKIIINGEEVSENDPRINGQGKNGVILKRMMTPRDNSKEKKIVEGKPLDMNGLTFVSPAQSNAAFLGVLSEDNELGAKINEVSEGSPAEKAGLKKDDIITNVNDEKITGPKDLYEAIGKYKPADKVQISILKNGTKTKLTAELEKNKAQSFSYSMPNQGITIEPNFVPNTPRGRGNNGMQRFGFELPQMPELNNLFGNIEKPKLGISVEDIEENEGVKISSVSENSPAAKAGLKEDDIITEVNDKKVKDVDGIKPIIKGATEGTIFKFNITRNGKKTMIEVKIPKKLKTADL